MDAKNKVLLPISDAAVLIKVGAGGSFAKGTIVMINVITASAGLRPYFQSTSGDGQIAAVFHRSILCTAPDGHLLHLDTGPRLASPFSLRLTANFVPLFHATPLTQGMPVRKREQMIALATNVRLRLGTITYYRSPRSPAIDVKPEAIRQARQVLKLYGRVGGFDKLPGAPMIGSIVQQALADNNAAQLLSAVCHLIGRGPGLTPSGDVFLVSCLRGLWLMPRTAAGARQMLDHLQTALLPDLKRRTTRVSAEFIRYALEGAFAEVLDQAALALLAPMPTPIKQTAVNYLPGHVETSGTDTMLGLLTCLEAMLSIPERQPRREPQDTVTNMLPSTTRRG